MKTKALIFFQIQFLFLFNIAISKSQAPNLGLAYNFALFTADGAFGNVGNTSVIGDIGTNVGAFSGFPTGTVDGGIFLANPISAQAAIDVQNAYSFLYDKTADRIIGTVLDGQIIEPGVSSTGGASSLAGLLKLDAQNNADAIFVIKIGGALLVSANSSVVLINSASWDNVYWQIDGKFDLGVNANFKGTIITNGAISLLVGSALQGRGLSCGGAISLDNNTVVLETRTLPIELLSFSAYKVLGDVQFDWYTASEVNNDCFTVLKSLDGENYTEVITVKGAGNTNSITHYMAKEKCVKNGIYHYWLKQTDFDGRCSFSDVVIVDIISIASKNIQIYPNPFAGSLTIDFHDDSIINNTELKIYNSIGAVVMKIPVAKTLIVIETGSFNSGVYFYQIVSNSLGNVIQTGKLVSQ